MISEKQTAQIQATKHFECQKPSQSPWQNVKKIQKQIIQDSGCLESHQVHDIPINQSESIHTIFIKGKNQTDKNIYLGHGFGGSSLTYFHCFDKLREKGNVVVWQLRGMGLNDKPSSYKINDEQISEFYSEGFQKVLNFYNHKNIVLINHSFSCYVTLRYLIQKGSKNISKMVLLSPVGLTPKQIDDKNRLKSFSDIWDVSLNKFGWKFNLTYKSPLRSIFSSWKDSLLKKSFQCFNLEQNQVLNMTKIFNSLISLKDGSENLFFKYFHPRVLPRVGQSIVELLGNKKMQIPTSIIYGDKDWVDTKGAIQLAANNHNIKMNIMEGADHMIIFSKDSMQKIIDQEL